MTPDDADTTRPPPPTGDTPDLAGLVSERPLPAGAMIGQYAVRRPIGRGGMGATVYEAIQKSTQRLVALKVLPLGVGHDAVVRFQVEARISASVKHQSMVVVHDAAVDRSAGVAYLVMELVPGAQTLDRYVRDHAALTLRDRVTLMIQVCDAVQEAHRRGLVHRDLKPGNVLVSDEGVPKVIDFGIATAVNSEVFGEPLPTVASGASGTPAYMSPEQARAGTVDARSDVFSLGATLFEVLTGEPFRRPVPRSKEAGVPGTVDAAAEAWKAAFVPMPATPPSRWNPRLRGDADRVVLRALEIEPGKRFPDAGALGRALQDVLDDRPPGGSADGPAARVRRAVRGGCRAFPRLTVVLVMLLGACAGMLTLQQTLFDALRFARFEKWIVRADGSAAELGDTFAHVTIVTMDDASMGRDQIAALLGAWHVEPAVAGSAGLRGLQAVLIDRLVECGVTAIAMDFKYDGKTENDAKLAAAARRANSPAVNVPVIAVADDWDDHKAPVASLDGAFRFRGSDVDVGRDVKNQAAWSLHLADEVRPGVAVSSLALETVLAAQDRQAHWRVSIDSGDVITVRNFHAANGVDTQGRPLETELEPTTLVPTLVRRPGDDGPDPVDRCGARMRVAVPGDDVLARSTVRYADVVDPNADVSALRHRLQGQIVLVGDLRKEIGEKRKRYPDGRELPLLYANAAAMEQLARKVSTHLLSTDPVGLSIGLLCTSSLGVALAWLARAGRWHMRAATGVVAIACIAGFAGLFSWLAVWQEHWLINPGPLLVAGVSGFLLFVAARRSFRLPLA